MADPQPAVSQFLGPALVDLTGMAWRLARTRLAGLSDEEFFWEPVADCWSVRLKAELRTPLPDDAAPGEWWIDWEDPAPDPAPFTTIAWLVAHMVLGTWNWIDIIAGREVAPEPPLAFTATAAVEQWEEVMSRFEALVAGFSDEQLRAGEQAWGGQVARSYLVEHVVTEVLHHAAEVGRLRDLYRQRGQWQG